MSQEQPARADYRKAHLEGRDFSGAHLEHSDFGAAYLEGANLRGAHLEGTYLYQAHLEGADLRESYLIGADLRGATFDKASRLNLAHLNEAMLDQVIFDNANLTVVDWREINRLGDEVQARRGHKGNRQRKDCLQRQEEYYAAARAYRLLSLALRNQGVISQVAFFQYRGQIMGQQARRYDAQKNLLSGHLLRSARLYLTWLLMALLGILSGYGIYHLWRLFLTYAGIVAGFAVAFYVAAHQPLRLPTSGREVLDALALSITAFHGRGLQPAGLHLSGGAMDGLAIAEAVLGLLVEGLFIAAFTRRIIGS